MNTMEKISIIIPCRNEERYIGNLLKQISKQKGIGKIFSLEVLIVDGRSNDKTRTVVKNEIKKNRNIVLIDNPRKITPVAFNLGIKQAKGDYICILGAHATIANNYIASAISLIEKTGADNVGGPTIIVGENYVGRAIACAFQNPFSSGGSKNHNAHYEGWTDTVYGGFYKQQVFNKIGLFDENLVRNQDDEFNFRLRKSGGKIWQSAKIKFKSYSRTSLFQLFKQNFQYGYWRVKVLQKHKQISSIRYLIPSIFVLSLLLFSSLAIRYYLFRTVLLAEISLYFTLMIISTLLSVKKENLRYLPVFPAIFITYHLANGVGVLFGLVSIIIFRRKSMAMLKLTR